MDLLTNAVESIQVGIEDYFLGSRPRLLSAVRNIHAGILLLYKEALRRESPKDSDDVLMMAKIKPSRDAKGKVTFVGVGKKTADTFQIEERFKSLKIETDWKRFGRINDVRNDVEHRYPGLDQNSLAGLVSDSFILVRDFITNELDDDPLALLGPETWKKMLKVQEVYEKERKEAERLLAEANWPDPLIKEGATELNCPLCGGDILKPIENSYCEIILQCVYCGEEEPPDQYVPRALQLALSTDAYIAMTDGGDPPVVSCPECGNDSFLTEQWKCLLCDADPDGECSRCGEAIPIEELDSSPLCGYCAYISNKDD
jgi:hypothetical protein